MEKEKTKWQIKREVSYDALVRSAMHRFHDRGYAATTVDDIVRPIGYTSGAFYFHFANKVDCFFHANAHRRALRGKWWEMAEGRSLADTSLEALLRLVFKHFGVSLEGTNAWTLVVVDVFQQHRNDPAVLRRLQDEVYVNWQQEVRHFLDVLQEGGWLPPEADPGTLAVEVLAFVEGLSIHATMFGDAPTRAMGLPPAGVLRLMASVPPAPEGRSSKRKR